MNNVISFSGGKDSTAMVHQMLERGESIHSLVFFDTGWEFPEMLHHIDLVEQKTGLNIVRLKPVKSFEYWMFERVKTKGVIGQVGYGWPNTFRWCTDLKIREIDKYRATIKDSVDCIGFAADEIHRVKPGKRYPLIEYGMSESDCLQYCKDLGYTWDGLYESFYRVSCWCCPNKSLQELRNLRRNFPDLWAKLLDMDFRQPVHAAPFKSGVSVSEFELRFSREEKFPKHFPLRFVRRMMKRPNLFEVAF